MVVVRLFFCFPPAPASADATPPHALRSYINTGIALERFDDETGAMSVLPGSHAAKTDHGLEALAEFVQARACRAPQTRP